MLMINTSSSSIKKIKWKFTDCEKIKRSYDKFIWKDSYWRSNWRFFRIKVHILYGVLIARFLLLIHFYFSFRKRAKVQGQFKGLVRGAKKGAAKGSKKKHKKWLQNHTPTAPTQYTYTRTPSPSYIVWYTTFELISK